MKLVYLVSNHNAGSTPIALVANAHPAMVSPGEMVGPGGRFHDTQGPVCSCGNTVDICPFWKEVGARYQKKNFPWQPDKWGLDFRFPGHTWLSRFALNRPDLLAWRLSLCSGLPWFSKKIENMLTRNLEFARIVLNVSGREVILDASKHPQRLYHLCRIPELDLRIIHLLRDPRGWCNSRRKNFNEPLEQTAHRWVEQNSRISKIISRIPQSQNITLRYEEFCEDPQSAMMRIWTLADLPTITLPDDLNTIQHHLLGNRMRTQRNLKITQDLSWQTQLSIDEQKTIEQITAPVADHFGYYF